MTRTMKAFSFNWIVILAALLGKCVALKYSYQSLPSAHHLTMISIFHSLNKAVGVVGSMADESLLEHNEFSVEGNAHFNKNTGNNSEC
jgi:hypothetical protein